MRRHAVLLGLAVTIAFGLFAADRVPRGDAGGPLGDKYAFRDPNLGTTLLITLADPNPAVGGFSFTIPGVGMAWPDDPADVVTLADGRFTVDYTGPGRVDSGAILDPIFGLHQATSNGSPVTLDLSATLDPDLRTGTATLQLGSNSYTLNDPGLIPGAEAVVSAAAAATESEDWAALFALMSDDFQAATTLAEFSAGVAGGFDEIGEMNDVIADPLTHLDGQAGYDLAHAVIRAFLDDGNGNETTVVATIGLGWEVDRWAVLTIRVPPDASAPATVAGPLPAAVSTPTVSVPYEGTDEGSGIDEVELWSRYRPTSGSPWGAWTEGLSGPGSPMTFTFGADGFYEFATVGTDRAGNREPGPSAADTATQKVSTGWSSTEIVNDVLASTQLTPAVAIGPDGAAHAVWRDGRPGTVGWDIFYARRDPVTGAWSANVRVNDVQTGNQDEPAIAVDGSSNIYVVWNDRRIDTDADIYYSKRSVATGSWSPSVRVNDDAPGKRQDFPSIAVSSSGAAIATWRDQRGGGTKYNIYSARLAAGGTTWGVNLKVTDNANAVKQHTEVALALDGVAHAVWHDDRSGSSDIYYSTLPAGGSIWAANTKVSDEPTGISASGPDIGVDDAGSVTIAWADSRNTPKEVRARRNVAGSWQTSVVLGTGSPGDTQIAVRSDGSAYVVWHDGPFIVGTMQTVWGARYDHASGTWTAAEQISDLGAGTAAGRATVAMDATQVLVLFDGGPLTSATYDADIRARRLAL